MQKGYFSWKWVVILVVIVSVSAYADVSSNEVVATKESLEKTRLELQEQGFKTDLANFDFTTTPGSRDWDAILKAIVPSRNVGSFVDNPDLMEPTGSNSVIVLWEQDSLRRRTPSWPDASYELTWDDFADAVNQSQPQIDAACAAILSGPIQFNLDASAGNSMLLPELAFLKNLTQMLNDRAMLALHDGNREAAWKNMMAATRSR